MSCPDIERIIDLVAGDEIDPEAHTHLQTCSECRAQLTLLREVRSALDPELSVPPEMIEAAFEAAVPPRRRRSTAASVSVVERFVAGALGGVTVLLTLVGTQAVGDATPSQILIWITLAGIAVAVNEGRTRPAPRRFPRSFPPLLSQQQVGSWCSLVA